MKKVLMGLAVFGIFMGITSAAVAAKVAVLDVTKVVKEYNKYKEASQRLEKEVEDTRAGLEKEQQNLAKRKNELDSQKGIVSEKKYQGLQEKFMGEQEAFVAKYREYQQSISNKQKTLLENIENDVLEVVKKIARKEKYDLVLDKNATYYHNGDDITFKVLSELNK